MKQTAIKRFCKCSAVLVVSLIFILIFSSMVFADVIPIRVETAENDVNIYAEGNTSSEVITVIKKEGTCLYPVSGSSATWYKLRFANDIYGYVPRESVKDSGPLTSSVSLLSGAALKVQPSAAASVQKLCSVGTELSISGMDDTGNWYYAVAFNGEKGYIKTSSVTALGIDYPFASAPLEEVEDITIIEMNAEGGRIRADASTSSAQLAKMSKGTLLSVVGSTKGSDGYTWYKVKYNGGKLGYVRSDIVVSYDISHIKGKTVVIDPGHGSYTNQNNMDVAVVYNGNTGVSGSLEKDINLIISRYLQSYLTKAGANVIMTRESDVGLMTLTDRATVANNVKADVFISVHLNYSTLDSKKTGVMTYYWPDGSGNARANLAKEVQTASYIELGAADLGTPNDERFTVLTATTVPSVLVELGFMSNAAEDALLIQKSYQMCCAQGLYKGLLKYFE